MLDPDLLRRLEQTRLQVERQRAMTRRLRRDSKAVRAAASAIADEAVSLRLTLRGVLADSSPPVPTHPPDW